MLWVHLDDFGASEFRGGRLTGPLFKMAVLGSLLFLLALLRTFFLRRTAATTALAATLFCFPFYLYILMPGPIPMDIQRRIHCTTLPTISLGQLGGCWSIYSPVRYTSEPSQ